MARILTRLTVVNLIALSLTFILGLISWARGGILLNDINYDLHFYFGLFSVISALGLHCLIFIYFLGTGRWVKEVALAYKIPDDPLPKKTRELKRKTFPPALFAMLIPIATAAAGMAQLHNQSKGWQPMLHLSLALATLAINFWAFAVEWKNVSINAGIIDEVMKEVNRIRAEAGLESNEEALAKQES